MINGKSVRLSVCGLVCLAAASAGCTVHQAANGEKALWSTVNKPTFTAKDLKDPTALHLSYARWQEQLGQLGDARQSYHFVLDDDPKSTDAILGIARIDQLAGRTNEADYGFARALNLKPDDPHVLHSVGQYYAQKNDWASAAQMLGRATHAVPEHTTYRYHLAVALARTGDVDASLSHFSQTIGEPAAHYNLGRILLEQGNRSEAERQLALAVAKSPDLKQAQVLLADIRGEQPGRPVVAVDTAASQSPVAPNGARQPTPANAGPIQQTGGQARQQTRLFRDPRPQHPVQGFHNAQPTGRQSYYGSTTVVPRQTRASAAKLDLSQIEQWNPQVGQ